MHARIRTIYDASACRGKVGALAAEPGEEGTLGAVELRSGERLARIPGVAFVYTNTYTGIPAAFTNMLANMPALHEVVVFITVRCARPAAPL
jgi:hypothetical protein